jgi:hypothetical protein
MTALAMLAPFGMANAAQLSPRECGIVLTTSAKIITQLGAKRFDARFPASLAAYLAPTNRDEVHNILVGKNSIQAIIRAGDATTAKRIVGSLTCNGDPNIQTKGVEEVAAFNTIKTILDVPPTSIVLENFGVRSVDPAALATARPAGQRRSDAGSPRVQARLD